MIKAKTFFTLIVGGAILFYLPFNQELLFNIGPAKVYAQDLASLFFTVYLLFALTFEKNRSRLFQLKSTKLFILFFIWGLIAIFRGFTSYGFHTVGEARWYLLIMFYYLFILLVFKQRKDITHFIKLVGFFVIVMIFLHFIQFYFLGLDLDRTGRGAFRFLNAVEALLVSFVLVWLYLAYVSKYKIMPKYNFYLLAGFCFLSTVLVIAQVRTAWVASLGGLLAVLFVSKKRLLIKSMLFVGAAVIFFLAASPLVTSFVGSNVINSIEKSAIFVSNPNKDADSKWRLIIWAQALNDIQKRPIIGEGLGGYSKWFVNGKVLRVMAHNGYLMNLMKFGVIGFFLLFIGIYNWYKEMNKYIKQESDKYFKLLGIGLEIALFMHLIYVTFYSFTMFFWIILGLGSALIISSKNKDERIESKNIVTIQKL